MNTPSPAVSNMRRIAMTAVAAALFTVGVTGCTGMDKLPDPDPDFNTGATDGTVTVTAPTRLEGADSTWVSDSIIVTLSKGLADDGWQAALSDGSCTALSPGVNTAWTGADGVEVTIFQQTKATHIILWQPQVTDDLNCDLEYSKPESIGTTFETTIKVGE